MVKLLNLYEKSSRTNVLRIFSISKKAAKFEFESDIQNARFSEKLDKNNWTRKNGPSLRVTVIVTPSRFVVFARFAMKNMCFHNETLWVCDI